MALAAANCAKLDQCIKNGTTLRYGDLTACQARQTRGCLAGLAAPGTGNSAALVMSCSAAVPAASCDDFEATRIAECQPKVGQLANGAACAFSSQCASTFCAIANGTNCGACAAPTHANDSCAASNCSVGQSCVAGNMQCQTDGSAGASCDKDHPCAYLLSCVTAAGASSGTCQLSGATAGAACDNKRQTLPACAASQGLFCEAASKTCKALTYVNAGNPCGFVNGTTVACTSAATCFGAMGATPGTCKALAKEGQPCDTAAGPGCVAPGRCVTGSATSTAGTCALPDSTTCT